MGVLQFNGSSDRISWVTLTSTLQNVSDGAWTMAILMKMSDLGHFNAFSYMLAGGSARVGCSYSSTSGAPFIDAGGGKNFPTDLTSTTSPYLLAVSKAAGSVAPRISWKLGSAGSWVTEDSSNTMSDTVASDSLEVGVWQTTADFFEGWIGVVAWWEGAMSDTNKQALDDNWRTSDLWNSAHGQPKFLVQLNVAAGSVVDLAGNASGLVASGTTLDAGETLDSWNFNGVGGADPVKIGPMRARGTSW